MTVSAIAVCSSCWVAGGRAHLHIQANFAASFLNNAGNVIHTELLCELVVHSHLPSVCWVVNGQLYAAHLQQYHKVMKRISGRWSTSTGMQEQFFCLDQCSAMLIYTSLWQGRVQRTLPQVRHEQHRVQSMLSRSGTLARLEYWLRQDPTS